MVLSFDATVLSAAMATFGETAQGFPAVVYTPATGAPFVINGIFDPMSEQILIKNGEPVTVHRPIMGCKASDFPNPPTNWNELQGDHITARGRTYVVREVFDDGHGGVEFHLNNTSLT